MSSLKKHSGRRGFLRTAVGTAIALPALEFTHDKAWAGGSGPNLRFLTVFSHGGTISNQDKTSKHDGTGAAQGEDLWRPSDPTSPVLTLGQIHEPLQPWVDKLTLLESIDNKTGIAQGQYGGGHGFSNVTALTAANVEFHGSGPVAGGPSIDEVLAQRLAVTQPVPFERMHLMLAGHNYGSPYFRDANQRVAGERNPGAAFSTFFDGVSGNAPDPETLRRNGVRRSMLSGLQDEYARVRMSVSAQDSHTIEAHLDHLASLEAQLDNTIVCEPPSGIPGNEGHTTEVADLHAQLIVAALRCGLTNVANLEIGDFITPWTAIGNPTGVDLGHALHHLSRDVGASGPRAADHAAWREEMLQNRQWRMGVVAKILEGLDDPNFLEGDNTLLDNSLMLMTSEFSAGAKHLAFNQPVLLAGRAGGQLQGGQYIDYNKFAASDPYTRQYESDESTHNLFVSILQMFGEADTSFGSNDAVHDGPLPGLL